MIYIVSCECVRDNVGGVIGLPVLFSVQQSTLTFIPLSNPVKYFPLTAPCAFSNKSMHLYID